MRLRQRYRGAVRNVGQYPRILVMIKTTPLGRNWFRAIMLTQKSMLMGAWHYLFADSHSVAGTHAGQQSLAAGVRIPTSDRVVVLVIVEQTSF